MFTLDDLQPLRGLTGVYFLYNSKKELVYIGKSTNIYLRILEHNFENKKDFSYFKATGTVNLLYSEMFEIYLIEKYKKKCNLLNKATIETSFSNFYFHLPTEIKEKITVDSLELNYKKLSVFIENDNNDFNTRYVVEKDIEDLLKEI